jgi:galactokinase
MTVQELFENTFGLSAETTSFAPGRVEFIGNHTDYNGGDVMGVAIDKGVFIAASKREDDEIHMVSTISDEVVVRRLSCLEKPLEGNNSWTNYPIGVICSLLKRDFNLPTGFNIAVASNLPVGAGLSSSAAIELSTLHAIMQLNGFDISKADMARIGRQSENEYVGIPSGILDQGTSSFGKEGSIIYINCKEEDFSVLATGKKLSLWIFNTDHKHSLVDSLYGQRHQECSEAFDYFKKLNPDLESICDLNLEVLQEHENNISLNMFKRTRHVITEHRRVHAVKEALNESDLNRVGKLLLGSHRSSQHDFENSIPELDFLVDTLIQQEGVLGARLSGGGFGGAVMALTVDSFESSQAEKVAEAYKDKFGVNRQTTFFNTYASDGPRSIQSL